MVLRIITGHNKHYLRLEMQKAEAREDTGKRKQRREFKNISKRRIF